MEAAEKELQNILVLRHATAYEKRMESLKNEIQATEDEFRLAGALSSGAFVKKLLHVLSAWVRPKEKEKRYIKKPRISME